MAANLADETYINLATFRRDGRAVETPVWCVGLGGNIYVFTDGTSAKVRRLRRSPKVRLAACGMTGTITGPWVEGTGKIIEDQALIDSVYAALEQKYGWQMWAVNFVSRLGGRISRRVVIELTIDKGR